MSLQQRRLLFYSFIFLFILVSPFAILYATGRAVNWQRLEIQKTASLIIKSQPEGADILLNKKKPILFLNKLFGKTSSPQTPAKLSNLTPGTYTVRLELVGYIPWEEKITIKPNEVVTLGPIRLYKTSSPTLTIPLAPTESQHVSPDRRTLLSFSDKQLNIIQVPEEKQFKQPLTTALATNIIWSNDQEMFIVNEDIIFNRTGELVGSLKEKIKPKPSFVRFASDDNDLLYYIEKNQIHRYSRLSNSAEIVADISDLLQKGDLFDYTVSGRHIYLIFKRNDQTELVSFNFSSPDRQTAAALPNGKYQFLTERNKILLLEKNNRILYYIEQPLPLFFSPRVTMVAKEYEIGQWQDETLIYTTPFEIREWDNNQEKLISRLGEEISGLARLTNNNQILYTTATAINIRPPMNTTFSESVNLANINKITTLLTVSDESLYFVGEFNNQFGIFHLTF